MLRILRSLDDLQQHYDWMKHMRKTQPIWLDENTGCWHLFRHRDVCHALAEFQSFSSQRRLQVLDRSTKASRILLDLDPPEHRRYRSLVSPFFTPQALARLSERIAVITQILLDQVRFTGHMDMMNDIASPLPTTVIAELLGVPSADLPRFKRWTDQTTAMLLRDEERQRSGEDEQTGQSMPHWIYEMSVYFRHVLEERRRVEREDLISALVRAKVEGESLTEEEIISFCFVLLRAGHVTTSSLLSQAIRCFDEHPAALEYLRTHPESLAGSIEEILRYASPIWKLPRTTRTDVTIDGVTIPQKSRVFVWLASANRDEEQFPNPERFEILRSPNKHVAFGHGIHFCVGAALARLEASIALPMLLEQLPDLHVSREEPIELSGEFGPFDFRCLPVTFIPSTR